MNSAELKKLQSPLKEQYRNNPETAIITLKAQGKVSEGVACKVSTGKHIVEAGLHPATGGNGMLACSGDMLLEALVACAGVTLSAVATAIEVNLTDATIIAEGDLDFSGTLGVSKEVPVGFKDIRLKFVIMSDAPDDQVQTLIKLTERYCVVYQTLQRGVTIKTIVEK